MTAERAIGRYLASVPAIVAIVSTRVHESFLPQSATLPALCVQLISGPRTHHLRGSNQTIRTRIQVDSYVSEDPESSSDPGDDVDALAQAVEDALDGQGFVIDTVEVTAALQSDRRKVRVADELRMLRVMQDFIVWSRVTS